MADFWRSVAIRLQEEAGIRLEFEQRRSCSGGCIHSAWWIPGTDSEGGASPVFLKENANEKGDGFEAEFAALEELGRTKTIRVPRPLSVGSVAEKGSYLALEALDLTGRDSASNMRKMGEQLAQMHGVESLNGWYGWERNNTIGATPQSNAWSRDWVEFFRQERLGYQVELARKRGRSFLRAEEMLDRLPEFFESYTPAPSLLHGDLWRGNAGFLPDGEPVIFDPATYYGDREADLAFTEFFGGFDPAFYRGYEETWPLSPGYETRKDLYNLYHVLNHDHLFGGGYARQAEDMMERLLG